MPVKAKGRRKISIGNRSYLWQVDLDSDGPYYICHIVSEDKSLLLDCPLKVETSYIISKGRKFQNQDTDGKWHRYLLPFHVLEIITPRIVREIIEWSMKDKDAVEIEWNEKNIPV